MRSHLFIYSLIALILCSCGHKDEDISKNVHNNPTKEEEAKRQAGLLAHDLDEVNSYEANEMKSAGLIFQKSLTVTNDQTMVKFSFDRNQIAPESSVESIINILQLFVTKGQILLDKYSAQVENKNGLSIRLDETTLVDLPLKIKLCQTKIETLNELKMNASPDLQFSEMNKEINELTAFEGLELRPIGLAFGSKEFYINGLYTKTISLDFTELSPSLPGRTYVEVLSHYIAKASEFLKKYNKGSYDQLGNKQNIPEIFKNELAIKIELSKNVIREILD